MTSLTASLTGIPEDGVLVPVTLTGVGTTWTPGTPGVPTFTLANAGGAAASIASQTVSSATSATVVIDPGVTRGTITITDPSTGDTAVITVGTSFAGVPIMVLADGVPRKTAADVTLDHIPGGAITYVDIGGQNLLVLDLSLLFLSGSAALDFEALEGTAGQLVCFDGTYPLVVLQSLQRSSRGVTTSGPTVLSAEFLLCSEAS